MKNKKSIYIIVGMVVLMISVKLGYNYLKDTYAIYNASVNNSVSSNDTLLKQAKDFTVYDVENNPVNLSDYKGKKSVVVNFWASWCPPCKAEMPYFQEATDKYINEDVEILMVNLTDGQRETKDKANSFLFNENYNLNVLYDSDEDAARKYFLNAVPRTLFIDIDGNIIYDHVGMINNSTLNNGILKLLNK